MKSQKKDIWNLISSHFSSKNPLICWKWQLCSDRGVLAGFVKQRDTVREQMLLTVPCFFTSNPWDQEKPIVRTSRKREMWLWSEQCSLYFRVHFICSFPGLTDKSSCMFGVIKNCLDFILLMSIMINSGAEKVNPDTWGANRKTCPQGALLVVAASRGTNSNCTWD